MEKKNIDKFLNGVRKIATQSGLWFGCRRTVLNNSNFLSFFPFFCFLFLQVKPIINYWIMDDKTNG